MEKIKNGRPTGLNYIKKVCEFRVLFDYLHTLAGSIDGVQQAANRSENTVISFTKGLSQLIGNEPSKRLKGPQ